MRSVAFIVTALTAACVAGHTQGNKPDVIVGFDFEMTSKLWQAVDPQDQVSLATDDEHVRKGTSSLEFRYKQRMRHGEDGPMPGALVVTLEGGLPDLHTVHFSVKAVRQMPLLVGLAKQNGSLYAVAVWVPPDKWLDVDLPIEAFSQAFGDGRPDPDGRLDPASVAAVALVDMTPILTQNFDLPAVKPTFGEQTMWLDDVEFLSDALPVEKPAHSVADGEPIIIDTCRHTFSRWICLGGEVPSLSESPEGKDGPGLRVGYATPANTAVALYHPFAPGLMQGAKRVDVSLKASVDCTASVTFEMLTDKGRPSFSHPVQLRAADGWKRFSLPLSEFKADDETRKAQMDPAKLSALAVIDLTPTKTHQPVTSVLQVDDVLAVK